MSFRQILSPLLIISYVCGSRIIEFPTGVPRYWISLLYMLLLWSLYNFVVIYVIIPHTIVYDILYHVWFGTNMFVAFLSIIIGIYYNKAFRNCIKDLTVVDDTLEKLGITTDYKLYMRTVWLILGFWFIIVILIIYFNIPSSKRDIDNIVQAIFTLFMQIYCIHITIISDLTVISMLWYVGLKFVQINEHLQKLTNDNKRRTMQNWGDSVLLLHQSRYTKTPKNAYIIWIVIHLHSELRKISRKIDLIFGTQMTMDMGCYFTFIALNIKGIFDIIFKNYPNKIQYVIMLPVWFFLHTFRLFLINYECERISIKANATGNFLSKLSYSNCDDEIRENILQFLLMIQSPIKFCGLGLFQFGFKFLQSFTTSVVTVLVILLQAYINKYVHS